MTIIAKYGISLLELKKKKQKKQINWFSKHLLFHMQLVPWALVQPQSIDSFS